MPSDSKQAKYVLSLVRHALGLPNHARCSYRNYFVAGPGHTDYETWLKMERDGDALRYPDRRLFGGDDLFRLTRKGAEAALMPGEKLDREDFP